MAKEFNNFFSKIGKNISDSVQQTAKKTWGAYCIPDFKQVKPKFSLDNTGPVHIIDIVKSFDSKSSPHLDGLSLKFIKSVISEINVPLTHIFNLSFDQGILEKIVPLKFTKHLQINDLLYRHQYGFFLGKSTEHNLK